MAADTTLEIIKRAERRTIKAAPRRWTVERAYGWLPRHRRPVRDHERQPAHHEAMAH